MRHSRGYEAHTRKSYNGAKIRNVSRCSYHLNLGWQTKWERKSSGTDELSGQRCRTSSEESEAVWLVAAATAPMACRDFSVLDYGIRIKLRALYPSPSFWGWNVYRRQIKRLPQLSSLSNYFLSSLVLSRMFSAHCHDPNIWILSQAGMKLQHQRPWLTCSRYAEGLINTRP